MEQRIKGKIKDEEGNWRSCVHWRVFNYKLKDQKDINYRRASSKTRGGKSN